MSEWITTMVVEQTSAYQKRMRYDPTHMAFYPTEYDSLGSVRGVPYPYGWVKHLGTPPEPHLDIYLISKRCFALGDEVEVRIVGVFIRADGDHKLISVPPARGERTLEEIPE